MITALIDETFEEEQFNKEVEPALACLSTVRHDLITTYLKSIQA